MKMKKNQKSTATSSGFTLIEVLVSVFIFSIVVTAVGGIFIQSLKLQRRAFSVQQTQENINFILESMAREIRVSKICPLTGQCSSSSTLSIDHPVNKRVEYSLAGEQIHRLILDPGVNCASPPCDSVMNSSSVKFTRLNFFVSGTENKDGKQPRVTIVVTVKSASDISQQSEIRAQTSVSQRFLSDKYKK